MTENQLKKIAGQMKELLTAGQDQTFVCRALAGGLHLLIERNGSERRLAIARTDTAPSATEARTVAAAFGLPAALEWNWTTRQKRGKPSFHVAEVTWKEAHPDATVQPNHAPAGPLPAGPVRQELPR